MKVVSVQTMRNIDTNTIKTGHLSGLELMENAGRECTREILDFLNTLDKNHQQSFTVLCGSGNNGGDGFVIARHLQKFSSRPVTIYCTKPIDQCSPDAKIMAKKISALTPVLPFDELTFLQNTIIIDCLLGTGLPSSKSCLPANHRKNQLVQLPCDLN